MLNQTVFAPVMDALVTVTGPAVDATNLFLETLQKEGYATAITLMTDEILSIGGGAKNVETWLKENRLEPKTWELIERDVATDRAHLVAVITLPDDSQTLLIIDLLPVKGTWLVGRLEVRVIEKPGSPD